jgi:hypothetical protein
MAPSATTTVTETAPVSLPVQTLKTPAQFGAYKELSPVKFEKETEIKGNDQFEAAKVRSTSKEYGKIPLL